MAEKPKISHLWMDRRVAKESDAAKLDEEASTHEMVQGLPRKQAEEHAWKEYSRKNHEAGAVHHYAGLLASKKTGDTEEGLKHSVMYAMHMRKLGLKETDPFPEHLKAQLSSDPILRFKAHPADALVLD